MSLADFSRQKNPEHLRVTPPLKPQCVVEREGVWGRCLVHSSPSVLTLVLHSDLVQQMDHEGRGVTPQPFGAVTQLRQRVKKDSLVLLMAALAPLLCSVTPSSEVRAQLWPRNREHHAAGEMWPGETVPLPSVRDPRGSAPAFSLSLHPCIWVRTWILLPLHKCLSGDTRVKICWT